MQKRLQNPREARLPKRLMHDVPIVDSAGKVLNYALNPLMVEFKPRDLMQK